MRFNSLINHFKDIEEAYNAGLRDLSELIGVDLAEKFIRFREEFDAEAKLEEYKQKNIIILTRKSPRYPRQLLELVDSPICLYVKGDLNNFDFEKEQLFAIVGTRRPSAYGVTITRKLALELGSFGFVIVSGLALGIDAEAHKGALEANGKTIAFLGCGVDIPYPLSNRELYKEIVKCGGLIISEFPPGMTVLPGLFIARNRLISGISRGVLVVEGAKDSGALITARCAGDQGKTVFATPGQITSFVSAAPNFLLKQGAKVVTRIEDILEEFNLRVLPSDREKVKTNLTSEEGKVYDLLAKETKTTDEIVENLKISINECMRLITSLEMKKVIEKNFEGKYQLVT